MGVVGSAPAMVSVFVIITVWLVGLRRRRFPIGVVVVEAVAVLALGVGLDEPHHSLGPVYAMLFFRSLYGTHRAANSASASPKLHSCTNRSTPCTDLR